MIPALRITVKPVSRDHPFVKLKVVAQNSMWLLNESYLLGQVLSLLWVCDYRQFVMQSLVGLQSAPPHHTTTVLRPFFRDHPGEPVPEENFWTLWCKGRLTEADTQTIRLGATPSGLTVAHRHHPPIFYKLDALPAAQLTVSKHWITVKPHNRTAEWRQNNNMPHKQSDKTAKHTHFYWKWHSAHTRVGFLPAETCFCQTWGLNRFKPD